MTQHDSDSPAPESAPISSSEIETPRGGFMARPGMKTPPRHAVVIRAGQAPESDDIPLARASFLPPPPPSEPVIDDASEKITLRAIPSPRAPEAAPVIEASASAAVTPLAANEPTLLPQMMESSPPPSDAPVVASLRTFDSATTTPLPLSRRRANRSWLTIVAAAMAGLLLGVLSVVTTVSVQQAEQAPAAQPAGVELAQAQAVGVHAPPAPASEATPVAPSKATPAPASDAAPAAVPPASAAPSEAQAEAPAVSQSPARTRPTGPKRSIF